MLAPLVCLIVGISDGDTLTARCETAAGYTQIRVRIAAIDAPEKRQDYGARAQQALARLCHGQQAEIHIRTTDRYRRFVADVQCQGHDAGAWMVRNGWAMVYRQYARPDADDHLFELERAAQNARAGQWQALNYGRAPAAPWEWRRSSR